MTTPQTGTPLLFETIRKIKAKLDGLTPLERDLEVVMRIGKIGEEAGEVHEALTLALGQNPRKGKDPEGWTKVENELCDVVFTALVALETVSEDAEAKLAERLAYVSDRTLNLT
ncbi:MazG-like family protein [Streptomyces sp. NRRL S-350]|uniref:MazG-like family protein n=1 Tax=Streptomyces sp. NRRL S-350 TaxID=1463902 RepID=UPI0004C04B61|nr:MazG-like family protein [Streptomyces sp. NRRL S-350]